MLTIDPNPCPCGRPLRLVERIGSRNEDIIYLPGKGGRKVAVHPLHFYDVMEALDDAMQYQIIEGTDGLHFCVVPRKGADRDHLSQAIHRRIGGSLGTVGAEVPALHLEFVDAIERSPERMGKAKLIVSERTRMTQQRKHKRTWPKQPR